MNVFLRILSNRFIVVSGLTLPIYFFIQEQFIKPFLTKKPVMFNFLGFLNKPIELSKLTYFEPLGYFIKIVVIIVMLLLIDSLFIHVIRRAVLSRLLLNLQKQQTALSYPKEIQSVALNSSTTLTKEQTVENNNSIEIFKILQKEMNFEPADIQNTKAINITPLSSKRAKTLEDYLIELQNLIGLDSVKTEINSIVNFIKVNKIRTEKGLSSHDLSYHMVFTGNPGTGKTTIARILANIFKELNIISKGHLIELDRSGLVAGYMGQTAAKVKDVIDRAKGGVLFIDEAYSLANENSNGDYGKEAIDTLLKYMEDYRNDLIVIVAGYDDPMRGFINSNPGLKSRFNRFIFFNDYEPKELYRILLQISEKTNYIFSEKARLHLQKFFTYVYQTERDKFGNGRGVRNLFEKIITVHADRISGTEAPTHEDLSVILLDDIVLAIKEISKNKF